MEERKRKEQPTTANQVESTVHHLMNNVHVAHAHDGARLLTSFGYKSLDILSCLYYYDTLKIASSYITVVYSYRSVHRSDLPEMERLEA